MLRELSPNPITESDVSEAFNELDLDKDQKIDRKEFRNWYSHSLYFKERKFQHQEEEDEADIDPLVFPSEAKLGGKAAWVISAPLVYLFAYSIPSLKEPGGWRGKCWVG